MSPIAEWTPSQARARIRSGGWTGGTTGACLGYVQANLVVLSAEAAQDFHRLCRANPQALPLLETTRPGDPMVLTSAPGADIRTDLPSYHVHRHGVLDAEVTSLEPLWRDDYVAFLLGCSFSAENQLLHAGIRLRHLELEQGVPMFVTNRPCNPTERFHGPVVVSMRPIASGQVDRAVEVTERFPLAHGAPLHIGDPAAIGIADLARPDWGEAIAVAEDEVPVFWACGVTPQAVIREVQPDLAVTHSPGHMFITDLRDETLCGRSQLNEASTDRDWHGT